MPAGQPAAPCVFNKRFNSTLTVLVCPTRPGCPLPWRPGRPPAHLQPVQLSLDVAKRAVKAGIVWVAAHPRKPAAHSLPDDSHGCSREEELQPRSTVLRPQAGARQLAAQVPSRQGAGWQSTRATSDPEAACGSPCPPYAPGPPAEGVRGVWQGEACAGSRSERRPSACHCGCKHSGDKQWAAEKPEPHLDRGAWASQAAPRLVPMKQCSLSAVTPTKRCAQSIVLPHIPPPAVDSRAAASTPAAMVAAPHQWPHIIAGYATARFK